MSQDPGDLVRLILLVGEHLNQLATLRGREELTRAAAEARRLIRRDPVI
jgi:hypothetical protein